MVHDFISYVVLKGLWFFLAAYVIFQALRGLQSWAKEIILVFLRTCTLKVLISIVGGSKVLF